MDLIIQNVHHWAISIIQPALINLHTNEYNQEFHYYPFAVKLDKCVGSCNTLNDLSNKVCVQHDYRNKWMKNINKACIMRM